MLNARCSFEKKNRCSDTLRGIRVVLLTWNISFAEVYFVDIDQLTKVASSKVASGPSSSTSNSPTKLKRYPCAYCPYRCNTRHNLQRHQFHRHFQTTNELQYMHRCPRCNKYYKRKDTLTYHLRFQCGVDPAFHCPYCPYVCRHKSNLKVHIARHL